MTTQEETGRVAGSHGQSTAGFIIKMIRESEVDEYLKAILDTLKDRKLELESNGGLPGQKRVPEDSINVQAVAVAPLPPQPPSNTPKGKRVFRGKGTYYAPKQRPSIDMVSFKGTISPLKDISGVDVSSTFTYNGFVYSKQDVLGHCFDGNFEGHTLRYEVVGVGPKAVKILMVDEPPANITHNGKSLHAAWQSNEPVFIGHAALVTWLGRN